jgi:hypothetical protein
MTDETPSDRSTRDLFLEKEASGTPVSFSLVS